MNREVKLCAARIGKGPTRRYAPNLLDARSRSPPMLIALDIRPFRCGRQEGPAPSKPLASTQGYATRPPPSGVPYHGYQSPTRCGPFARPSCHRGHGIVAADLFAAVTVAASRCAIAHLGDWVVLVPSIRSTRLWPPAGSSWIQRRSHRRSRSGRIKSSPGKSHGTSYLLEARFLWPPSLETRLQPPDGQTAFHLAGSSLDYQLGEIGRAIVMFRATPPLCRDESHPPHAPGQP